MTNMMRAAALLLLSVAFVATANAGPRGAGLTAEARLELQQAGVDRYLGQFTPVATEDVGAGWTRHRFDQNQNGPFQGPMCVTGSEYSVFTRIRNPHKLLIFAQGGGACWQGEYNCTPTVDAGFNPPPPPVGLWSDEGFDFGFGPIPNPFADYSVLYLPYCDGSVFAGDNDVQDPNFPFGPIRFHRGMRNLSAGIDVARDTFPRARTIVLAGASAGGVGVAGFAPFVARFAFGDGRDMAVFNDAGPIATNLVDVDGIQARANDWQIDQFYPASCTECDVFGQATELVKWRLRNDRTIREAFYSTDADAVNRFFQRIPTQELYRQLILAEHGAIVAEFPRRYKRFIKSGSNTHTALQTPLMYIESVNGIPLNTWISDFLKNAGKRSRDARREGRRPVWVDLVEDFIPVEE